MFFYYCNLVKNQIIELIASASKNIGAEDAKSKIQIERPKTIEHGDFSSNIALQLAKPLGKNPREVGQMIIEALPANDLFEKYEIAGPGFINFHLSAQGRKAVLTEIFKSKSQYGTNTSGAQQKLQIEFVSANPTGPLHIGHGRGAAIGDSLARIYAANGWQVTREFYYNDAGAQIQNLALSVQARANNIDPDSDQFPTDGYRGDYILEIAKAYIDRTIIKTEEGDIQGLGDIENLEAIREFSIAFLRQEQNLDLAAFQTKFDVFTLESSFYKNGAIEKVVGQLKQNKFTYEQDDALWLKTTEFGDDKDRVMQKSDGGYTYFVPDVAYHLNKWERGFKRVINEQGADHHSTITRVRAGLQALQQNIPQDWPEYVLHQMVTVMRGQEEVKISKRAGSYVTLRDLIDEVGSDATRYFLIARKPDSQLVFDIDLAKSQTNENPVYYIQYAHARITAVLNQANQDLTQLHLFNQDLLSSIHEKQLIKRLSEFPDFIQVAALENSPHYIATYLKDLAGDFHSYYNDSKFLVEDHDLKLARVALIYATQITIKNGLSTLGISAPEKM